MPANHVNVEVNGHNLQFELDTGKANTVVSERVWRSLNAPNLSTAPQLTAYGGFLIPVLGSAQVTAKFKKEKKHLPLVVVNCDSPWLLGQIWMKAFNKLRIWLENAPVDSISSEDVAAKSLYQEFADPFELGLGKVRCYQAHIYIKPNARVRYFKPRPVSFAIKEKIETDLARLLKLGVIEPVQTAEFKATPNVPVPKPNGVVRICGDFKVTVNTYADMHRFPFLILKNCELHLPLTKSSRKYISQTRICN